MCAYVGWVFGVSGVLWGWTYAFCGWVCNARKLVFLTSVRLI